MARVVAAGGDAAFALECVEVAASHARASGALLLELRAAVERTHHIDRADPIARADAHSELQRLLDRFAGADADCADVRLARSALDAFPPNSPSPR